nr:MAG TPA: hypothetical protein [Caudoviricetes sp.]
MGFTTAAFIRKNTPELRNKLEELGYYLHPECIDDDRGNYLFVNREYYLNRPLGYLEEFSRSIDCGTNEELFLAIAALRDDTSNNQYWIFDEDFYKWKKGDFIIGRFGRCSCYCHVATVEELIEHFKEKEE